MNPQAVSCRVADHGDAFERELFECLKLLIEGEEDRTQGEPLSCDALVTLYRRLRDGSRQARPTGRDVLGAQPARAFSGPRV